MGGSSVSAGGTSGGGSLGGVENPTAHWWASTAAGAMSFATAGLLAAGVALPGIVVVGVVVILIIGVEHLIRAISGYWD